MNVNDGKDYRRYTYQVRKFNTNIDTLPPPPPWGDIFDMWHCVTQLCLNVLRLCSHRIAFHADIPTRKGNCPPTPPHPTPNPGFSLTCDLRAEKWVWGGVGGQFPTNLNWSQEAIRYWMNTYTILEVSFGWVVFETSSLKKADLSASLNYVN